MKTRNYRTNLLALTVAAALLGILSGCGTSAPSDRASSSATPSTCPGLSTYGDRVAQKELQDLVRLRNQYDTMGAFRQYDMMRSFRR
jgi:hypothetical protein